VPSQTIKRGIIYFILQGINFFRWFWGGIWIWFSVGVWFCLIGVSSNPPLATAKKSNPNKCSVSSIHDISLEQRSPLWSAYFCFRSPHQWHFFLLHFVWDHCGVCFGDEHRSPKPLPTLPSLKVPDDFKWWTFWTSRSSKAWRELHVQCVYIFIYVCVCVRMGSIYNITYLKSKRGAHWQS